MGSMRKRKRIKKSSESGASSIERKARCAIEKLLSSNHLRTGSCSLRSANSEHLRPFYLPNSGEIKLYQAISESASGHVLPRTALRAAAAKSARKFSAVPFERPNMRPESTQRAGQMGKANSAARKRKRLQPRTHEPSGCSGSSFSTWVRQ